MPHRPLVPVVAFASVLWLAACASEPAAPAGSRTFTRALALEDSGATSANVSLGDVDGDGHLDVVLVKGRHWPLDNRVLLGDGTGAFRPGPPVGAPADRSYSGILTDLDGDGDPDLVVSNDDPDPKRVLLNDGRGGFTEASTFGRPDWSTRHVDVADLDGDGHPDVILANRYGDAVGPSHVCPGTAGGGFGECRVVWTGSATTIAAADVDGDGHMDLVVPYRDGGQSRALLGDGAGNFDRDVPFGPPDATIRAARAADLDGDGRSDLVAIDERTGVHVFPALSAGGFGPAQPLETGGARPYALTLADVDGNGRTDVLVGFVESRPVVYFNDGPDVFTPVAFGDDEGVAYGFAVGDVDEDGYLDIALARSEAVNVLYFGGR